MNEKDYISKYYGQLLSIGLPESLYSKLCSKIHPELVYDAGNVFVFEEPISPSKGLQLCAKVAIPKHSDVFLVDHAWSHDGSSVAWQQLKDLPQLVSRMLNMFGVSTWDDQEFDEEWVSDPGDNIGYEDVICKVCDCSLESARSALKEYQGSILDAAIGIISGDLQKPRSGEPTTECSFEEFKLALGSCVDGQSLSDVSEEYLKKMYESFKKSGSNNVGAAMTADYNWLDNVNDGFSEVHVAIKINTRKNDIKSTLKSNHWQLEVKGMGVLVNGDLTNRIIADESFWTLETPGVLSMYLRKGNTDQKMLTELIKGEKQLSASEIEESVWKSNLKLRTEVKSVLDEMWKYSQTYSIASVSDKVKSSPPVWYIMDEVGSAVGHSTTPNFACKPFFIYDKQIAVSVIWPVEDIEAGDAITRLFLEKPCQGESYENFSVRANLLAKGLEDLEYSCSIEEALNGIDVSEPMENSEVLKIPSKGPHKVELVCFKIETLIHKKTFFCDFIDGTDFAQTISELGCNVTSDIASADFVLSKRPLLENPSAQCMVNHFTGEESLFSKRMFNTIIREQCSSFPWYPRIYSLHTEVSKVLTESKKSHFNQLWVLRVDDSEGLNIRPVLTSDIFRIIRLVESGLSVASKYVLDSARYNGRCFSLSYVLYIKRLLPTEIFVHKTPYIRETSTKYSSISLLNEYDTAAIFTEKPRTSFNRNKPQDFSEFVKAMEEINCKAGLKRTWKDIETEIIESIATMLKVYEGSLRSPSNTNSFGIIGVDFIFDSKLNPIFSSFNRMPYFPSHLVLKDVISALLYSDSASELLCENSFFKITW